MRGSEYRMRYLPIFLDLQTGPVLLVGAGELVRAKLRLLTAAGARIRWYATSGDHDISGLDPADAERIQFAQGDPLTVSQENGGDVVKAPIHPYEILTIRVDYPNGGPKE